MIVHTPDTWFRFKVISAERGSCVVTTVLDEYNTFDQMVTPAQAERIIKLDGTGGIETHVTDEWFRRNVMRFPSLLPPKRRDMAALVKRFPSAGKVV